MSALIASFGLIQLILKLLIYNLFNWNQNENI